LAAALGLAGVGVALALGARLVAVEATFPTGVICATCCTA